MNVVRVTEHRPEVRRTSCFSEFVKIHSWRPKSPRLHLKKSKQKKSHQALEPTVTDVYLQIEVMESFSEEGFSIEVSYKVDSSKSSAELQLPSLCFYFLCLKHKKRRHQKKKKAVSRVHRFLYTFCLFKITTYYSHRLEFWFTQS